MHNIYLELRQVSYVQFGYLQGMIFFWWREGGREGWLFTCECSLKKGNKGMDQHYHR
jgi:hypothetical protein